MIKSMDIIGYQMDCTFGYHDVGDSFWHSRKHTPCTN